MTTAVEAFEWWIQTSEGRVLSEVPIRSDVFVEQMRKRLESAYRAGFAAGAKSQSEESTQ